MKTQPRPSKSESALWAMLAFIVLLFLIGCDKPETAKPFPLDIEPIEGTQLFTIYRSEPIDVTFYNYWTDATYLLNFRCYDKERNQEWCVVGYGTVCVKGPCVTLE